MTKALEDQLISIIVPVYNVKEYIDDCLESIVNQTYKRIEIIIINDGSTDGSEEKCLNWQNKDKRIVYISKKNEGPGPTRNYGIDIARGDYIAFVDSDDWLDITFIEKMYNAIIANNADLVECDYYRVTIDSKTRTYVMNNSGMKRTATKAERIIWESPSICKILSKRKLWIEHEIRMPALVAEDLAVYTLLIALSEKISNVNEPLYFYRKNRSQSITSRNETFNKVPLAMEYLINNLKTRSIFEQYKFILYRQMLNLTSRCLIPCLPRMDKLEFKDCEKKYMDFLKENFPYKEQNVIVLGSYNLTKIANKCLIVENPYNRFHFISLASIMSSRRTLESPNHKNLYRKYMLNREFSGSFWEIVDGQKPEYIIIDFIEERHDLLEVGGSYYTKSDALEESDFDIEKEQNIPRNSEECQKIWKKACIGFVEKLKKRFQAKNVILIENYLAEQYGNIKKQSEYENIVEIKQINNILKSYYDFFSKNYAGIQRIEAYKESLYITDERHQYGCYPWHLNELVNADIASKIKMDNYQPGMLGE